jgi:hypothetical protein
MQLQNTVANESTSCKHRSTRASEYVKGGEKAMRRPRPQRLAWTALEGRLHVVADAHMCTCVDTSVGKDSMRRDFGGGSGDGMNAKHRARVLGPRACRTPESGDAYVCGRIQCPVRGCVMHLRVSGVGL